MKSVEVLSPSEQAVQAATIALAVVTDQEVKLDVGDEELILFAARLDEVLDKIE